MSLLLTAMGSAVFIALLGLLSANFPNFKPLAAWRFMATGGAA